jgi:hypothetical protein
VLTELKSTGQGAAVEQRNKRWCSTRAEHMKCL